MAATNHYRDQIHRATERLAQLQARELLANQRLQSKARETARREEAKRRKRVADLIFLAGANELDDAELLGALLEHITNRKNQALSAAARSRGIERLGGSQE
ncbi:MULTISPECIES: conjugal transfer protein TraD [unclassified Stenotrophomonas]|uniref:conjugal transfer protein TraD n=1 Tax=unclassified Stenotrophomonas TaxID=196198 RepID=UPI0009B2C7F3|nr:conjugal transfer protein TraD [Stenotrophomonas sp. S39]MBK0053773.1 conjugal transfer protein TraD [Stenotrophomonas sp. S39]